MRKGSPIEDPCIIPRMNIEQQKTLLFFSNKTKVRSIAKKLRKTSEIAKSVAYICPQLTFNNISSKNISCKSDVKPTPIKMEDKYEINLLPYNTR